MTRLPVSVLDLGIEPEDRSPGQSVADVVALSRRAEHLGFRRFWVAEHHGSRAVSGGVPAVMLARLAAETSSIRVGAGGVMLPNHAPVAVAEQFGTLGALSPGRVDLGIGRGPGSFDPDYIDALRLGAPPLPPEGYASRIGELLGYLRADEARGVRVWLAEDYPPEPWLLASSPSGAALAAELGLPVSFAYHIRPEITAESLARYRDRFTPSAWRDRPHVMLSVGVACAETDAEAAAMERSTQDMLVRRAANEHPRRGPEGATARPRFLAGSVHGRPQTVARELAELARRFAPDELILVPVHATVADRIRCVDLVSEQVIAG